MSPDPKVDAFLKGAKAWPEEMAKLRSILLDCGLDEAIKWGKPCYSSKGKNIAIIQPFKAHCALMFFQGALLDDPYDVLREQGANSRSAQRMEFTRPAQIKKTVIRPYVQQAVAKAAAGAKVPKPAKVATGYPEELTQAFRKHRDLAKAFQALTPGRQRSYLLHITGAKQSQTRANRIEKCIPKILAGKGFNER